jgi:2-polyprenyl-6-methoxyphenol hydroxylase-like FAD-dependent oxidoreductase
MQRIPVLIVGGGPVGLALAGELGWRGVACMLVEQGDGSIATPKMNEVNVRTMEFCRRWGIADAVHACPFPPDYPLDVAFVTSLSGYELGRMPRPPRVNQKPEPYSPMRLQVCSQMWFDPILQRFARTFANVSLRYRTRLESFAASGDGVSAEIVDLETGRRERVEADYLVGCDGANSMVRRALGIGLDGKTLGHPVHLYFRAPGLLDICGRKPTVFFITVDRAGPWSNVRIVDPANAMWRLMVLDTDGTSTPETIDREGYLRRALGRPLEVEWLGTSVWTRRSVVAERYSSGRVFLAGDAVHQLSPTGALGMNTGIADAVDLGWKLAAVLNGWGGERLLSSYDAERRPIGNRNVGMAAEFYLAHEKFGDGLATIEENTAAAAELRRRVGEALVRGVGRMFRTIGLQLGYRYEDSPICLPDGTPPCPDDPEDFVPSARPGSRAPHLRLADGRSILDLYGRGFVLLRLGTHAPEGSALEAAAAVRRVPLATVALAEPEAARLYEYPLVLVRPDGHVAWRGDKVPADAAAVIDHVRGAGAPAPAPTPARPAESGPHRAATR